MLKLIKRTKLKYAFIKIFEYRGLIFTIEKYPGLFLFKIEKEQLLLFEYRSTALSSLSVGIIGHIPHITLNKTTRIDIKPNGQVIITFNKR